MAAEVRDFDPSQFLDKKDARKLDRVIQFGVAASTMALQDSGLELTDDLREEVGVYVSSGVGGLGTMTTESRIMWEKGPSRVSPFWIPYIIPNMIGGYTSIVLDLHGPNMAHVSACSTGANALGEAWHVIKRGDAVAMLAGGAEATINELGIAGFCAVRAMSNRNDDPKHASRPFDKERDGFVMGEGAAVILLEDYDHAVARGAKIYAEMVGYGMTADAFHITAPHPEGRGAIGSMTRALKSAGLQPTDIGYINAHGTSTPIGDPMEVGAIKKVFGEYAQSGLLVSSTKSAIGHTLGAAGALETLFCALALRDQRVPPTINYEFPDPECDVDVVPNESRAASLEYALNNSFGFGGHNVSVILKRV